MVIKTVVILLFLKRGLNGGWIRLIENIDRDQANILALKKSGWRVITIWECQLKPAIRDDTLLNLSKIILTLK